MYVRTPTDVGALVREARRQKKLDQQSLAARVGVSRQWVIALERGRPGASIGLVLRTLAALGITLTTDTARVKATTARRIVVPDIDAVVRSARKTPRTKR